MQTPEDFRQRVQREKQLVARLRLAATHLEKAQRERIWAVVAAKEAGLSIRKIAAATDLSPSRIHQLLTAQETNSDTPPPTDKLEIRLDPLPLSPLVTLPGSVSCASQSCQTLNRATEQSPSKSPLYMHLARLPERSDNNNITAGNESLVKQCCNQCLFETTCPVWVKV